MVPDGQKATVLAPVFVGTAAGFFPSWEPAGTLRGAWAALGACLVVYYDWPYCLGIQQSRSGLFLELLAALPSPQHVPHLSVESDDRVAQLAILCLHHVLARLVLEAERNLIQFFFPTERLIGSVQNEMAQRASPRNELFPAN
jgi:hypothetical protein